MPETKGSSVTERSGLVICHHRIFFASHTAFDLFEFKPTMDKLKIIKHNAIVNTDLFGINQLIPYDISYYKRSAYLIISDQRIIESRFQFFVLFLNT